MSKIYSSPKLIRIAEEKNFIFTRILFHFRDLFKTLSKTYFIFMRSRKGVFSFLRKHIIFHFSRTYIKKKKKKYEKNIPFRSNNKFFSAKFFIDLSRFDREIERKDLERKKERIYNLIARTRSR